MTLNEVRKQYKQDGKLYDAVGNIIDVLKGMDEKEIRKVGLYFYLSYIHFTDKVKYSKKRIDQNVFECIICGVLELEHTSKKCYDMDKLEQDRELTDKVNKIVYSYKCSGKINIYRTSFGNGYSSSSYAVDLTV